VKTQWAELIQLWDEIAGEIAFGDPRVDTPVLEAEALRYIVRLIAGGSIYEIEAHDPAYPVLYKPASLWVNYGGANPDCCYFAATVHGDYTYRLFGRRGTAALFDIEIWSGEWAQAATIQNLGGGCDALGADGPHDFTFGADGEFEIFLGVVKTKGNWIALAPGLGNVAVRQVFNDWNAETPGEIFIERVGATYPPPPTTVDVLSEKMGLAGDFLKWTRMFKAGAEAQHYNRPENSFVFAPHVPDNDERETSNDHVEVGSPSFYYRNHVMGYGNFRCGPDEAVIMEMPAPEARLWTFYLGSHHWETFPSNLSQSSLNRNQAVIDADRMFRAVISHRDPAVPNWLDPNHHESGLIFARFFRPGPLPEPELRVVPFGALREALPKATPAVTPEERNAALARRMHAVHRRGEW
jgi:hypothetical protein